MFIKFKSNRKCGFRKEIGEFQKILGPGAFCTKGFCSSLRAKDPAFLRTASAHSAQGDFVALCALRTWPFLAAQRCAIATQAISCQED